MKLNTSTSRFLTMMTLGLIISFPSGLNPQVQAVAQEAAPTTATPPAATPTPFPVPASFPSGGSIKIDGSTSMTAINQALQKQFLTKFGDAKVELSSNGTEKALEAVQKGELDLAAIGRSLTDDEKAQGLAEYTISREKIAIIVGAENPFSGDLTFKQFAQMFRGELTDWSAIGGAGPVRFIDRPETSDTRKSLSTYPVFKEANFAIGANGKTVDADDTAAVIKELGKDGIGYGIASQTLNQPGVKVLSMHKTLPEDPRYPYSQPRSYVYKPGADGNPSPAVLAYLGYATSPEGQSAIADANKTEATAVAQSVSGTAASPTPAASPAPAATPAAATPTATTAAPAVETPGYANWWLPGLLGTIFFGWLASKLLKGGSHPVGTWGTLPKSEGAAPNTSMPAPVKPLPPATKTPATKTPATTSTATTSTATTAATATTVATAATTATNPPATTTPIATTPPTTSTPVATTTITPPAAAAGIGAVAAGIGAAGVAGAAASAIDRSKSWITLTGQSGDQAEAEWHILDADRAVIPNLPSREPQVRIYDVTGGIDLREQPAHSVQYYNCKPSDTKVSVTLPDGDREYIAAVGYITGDGRWFKMAQSAVSKRL